MKGEMKVLIDGIVMNTLIISLITEGLKILGELENSCNEREAKKK